MVLLPSLEASYAPLVAACIDFFEVFYFLIMASYTPNKSYAQPTYTAEHKNRLSLLKMIYKLNQRIINAFQ
jgi:hypothetical protein